MLQKSFGISRVVLIGGSVLTSCYILVWHAMDFYSTNQDLEQKLRAAIERASEAERQAEEAMQRARFAEEKLRESQRRAQTADDVVKTRKNAEDAAKADTQYEAPLSAKRRRPESGSATNWAGKAFQCCGLQRAYSYVMDFPVEEREDAYLKLKNAQPEQLERLLSRFPKWPGRYCTEDYDCNFDTEKDGSLIQCNIEHDTIDAYNKWVPSGAKVLEVGARYGQASCYLSKIVGSSGRVIAVDADESIWPVWERNIKQHRCSARLVKGVVGNKDKSLIAGSGYGTRTGVADSGGGVQKLVRAHSVESLGIPIDTLAIDCEGCFASFLSENPGLEGMLKLIVVETHNEAEKQEVERLVSSGWRSMDQSLHIYQMAILSKSALQPSNHPCLTKI